MIVVQGTAQSITIYGTARYEGSDTTVEGLKINLLDTNNSILQSTFTNGNGNYSFSDLQKNQYHLNILKSPHSRYEILIKGINFTNKDSLLQELNIQRPCKGTVSDGHCPQCGLKKNVSAASPGTIVSLNFGQHKKGKRLSRKYDKKTENNGYTSFIEEDGNEIITAVFIESEKEKFNSGCYFWFCKHCKKVFK